MRHSTATAFCVVLSGCLAPTAAEYTDPDSGWSSDGKADVFGADDRREADDPGNDPRAAQWARSTLAMVDWANIETEDAEHSRLSLPSLRDMADVCDDEPFASQPSAGHCSAFLVSDELVVTAGHCMNRPRDCDRYAFVFGFAMDGDPTQVRSSDVYACSEIVGIENAGLRDWAVVRLDRPVLDREPLTLRRERPRVGDALTLIGHPVGAPVKVDAGGAVIASEADEPSFRVTFDAYGGNSGSAVLDSRTGEVVGVHVAGGPDFEFDAASRCYRSLYCEEIGPPHCEGAIEVHTDLFYDAVCPGGACGRVDAPPVVPSPPVVNDVRVVAPGGLDFDLSVTGLRDDMAVRATITTGQGEVWEHWASGTRLAVGGTATFEWPELIDPARAHDGKFFVRFYLDEDDNRRCGRDWPNQESVFVMIGVVPSSPGVSVAIDASIVHPDGYGRTGWNRAPMPWGCQLFEQDPSGSTVRP